MSWDSMASFFDVVSFWANDRGSAVAAIDAHSCAPASKVAAAPTRLTYAELCSAAKTLATVLRAELPQIADRIDHEQVVATLMRRGLEWYCTYSALAAIQAPVLALSTDLQDKIAEQQRNISAMRAVRPCLLIVDGSGNAPSEVECASISFDALWEKAEAYASQSLRLDLSLPNPDATLCLCYTGGTTQASRCCRVTHRMALHEVRNYPSISGSTCLNKSDRVLQQHSVYWAAATFGEIDVALAFGCTLVFEEAWESETIAAAIRTHGISFVGLVPTFLAMIDPRDVPSLRLVFSWGEELLAHVAQKWAKCVHLIDVLISTECWLSFYADWRPLKGCSPLALGLSGACELYRPSFTHVLGAEVWFRPRDGGSLELLVAGPMVSPGYTDPCLNAESFVKDFAGKLWYCTKDCVEIRDGNEFVFAGRANDLVKMCGAWVDLHRIEHDIRKILGVDDSVCISGSHIFVKLPAPLGDDLLQQLRIAAPPGFHVFIVPKFPRHVATGKIDRQCLMEMMGPDTTTLHRDFLEESRVQAIELTVLLRCYTVLAPVAILPVLPVLHSVFLVSGNSLQNLMSVGFNCLLDILLRLLFFTYILFSLMDENVMSRLCRKASAANYEGAVFICTVMPSPLSVPLGLCLWLVISCCGMYLAMQRGRICSWPFVCILGLPAWISEDPQQFKYKLSKWIGKCEKNTSKWIGAILYNCRLLQRCGHCKQLARPSNGRVDAEDNLWYCNKCWVFCNQHQQCMTCKQWKIDGQVISQFAWVCLQCDGEMRRRSRQADRNSNRPRFLERNLTISESVDKDDGATETPLPKRRRLEQGPENDDPRQHKSREWYLIEQVIGRTFDSLGAPLVGIDSLRVARVASILRREMGIQLTFAMVQKCSTFGHLLDEIARLPAIVNRSPTQEVSERLEYRCWGMMWWSASKWILHRDRPLSETTMRLALQQLICRHIVLRAQPFDRLALFKKTQQALTMLRLWRNRFLLSETSGRIANHCYHIKEILYFLFKRALWSSWPRVKVNAHPTLMELPLLVLPSARDKLSAREALKQHTKWEPPLHVTFAPYGDANSGGAFVRFKVTHMLSDGFSIVPLLSDFASLVMHAEEQHLSAPCSFASVCLPPIPNVLSLLEERLQRTLQNDHSKCDVITAEALRGHHGPPRSPAMQFAKLTADTVTAIREVSRRLAVSHEIVMMTALGTTFAHFMKLKNVPVVMVVPQRDEPGTSDIIGLLVDFRQFNICTGGLSFAGVAARLHYVVKNRQWAVPHMITQHEAPFVNFEWTEFSAKAGFSQVINDVKTSESLQNPFQVSIEERTPNEWRLRIAIDTKHYNEEQRSCFLDIFWRNLQQIITDPLQIVWEEDAVAA